MKAIRVGAQLRVVVQAEFPKGHLMAGERYADADSLDEAQAMVFASLLAGALNAGIIAHYRPTPSFRTIDNGERTKTEAVGLGSYRRTTRH